MELNEQIELVSEWAYTILINSTMAGGFLPLFLCATVNYFIFGLGEQSFLLPWPMLWVSQFNYCNCNAIVHISHAILIPLLQIAIQLANTARIFNCVGCRKCMQLFCIKWWYNSLVFFHRFSLAKNRFYQRHFKRFGWIECQRCRIEYK